MAQHDHSGSPTTRLTLPALLVASVTTVSCSAIVAERLADKQPEAATTTVSSDASSPSCTECAPESCCNGSCVDLRKDALNCGHCGHACSQGRSCVDGRCSGGWKSVSLQGSPTGRRAPCVAWSGSRVVVWGGQRSAKEATLTNTGGVYDPVTDQWSPMNNEAAPSPRARPSCVGISDNRVFVWGGDNEDDKHLRDGAIYDVTHDRWKTISVLDSPDNRSSPLLFWTGRQVLMWGGSQQPTASLVRYQPSGNRWVSLVNKPTAYHAGSCAAWDDSTKRLYVLGGKDSDSVIHVYDETANRWRQLNVKPSKPYFANRIGSFCAVSQHRLLVWGGKKSDDNTYPTNLVVIHLDATKPTSLSLAPAKPPPARALPTPPGAAFHAATDDSLLVFGGVDEHDDWLADGLQISQVSDSSVSTVPILPWPHRDSLAPSQDDRSVWTGEELFVWHGSDRPDKSNDASRWMP